MIEKIYHYTDIATLGLILKNKTIRFKRFDLMDDRTETDGLLEMMKMKYFLSCWVLDKNEKIPQWAMYAPRGVRIEMPAKWYEKFLIPIAGTDQLPLEENGRKYYFSPPINGEDGFMVKVEYDENSTSKKGKYWREHENGNGFSLSDITAPIRFKDKYWSFQDEVRFYLYANYKHEDRHSLPEHVDLPIDENALKEIKIRVYPNCSEEDFQKVKDIVSDNFATSDSNEIVECSVLDGKYFAKNW